MMQEQTYKHLHFIPFHLIIRLRWLSLIGQISTVLILHAVGFVMPLIPIGIILGIALSLSVALHVYKGRRPLWNVRTFPYLLLYDFFHLALLLFFTGGLLNPFVMFLLGPIFLMASFNNMKLLCTVLISSSLVVSFLYITPYHLPWFDSGLVFDPLLRFAAALCLWGSILFYGTYLFYIHYHKGRLLNQLTLAQETLAEQRKISELGLMAAACAHEFGTPLSTILLAAREIELYTQENKKEIKEDAALIISQAKRCQQILKHLGSIYKQSSYFQVELEHFLTSTFNAYPHKCHFNVHNDLSLEYLIEGCPELSLAFGNLFQNAIRHAKEIVTVHLKRTDDSIEITLRDDGPGFKINLLIYLGDMLGGILTHGGTGEHLGMGLFIAKRLFAQKGIGLTFFNDHGAVCRIEIPTRLLEPMHQKATA